jgi:thiol-disulfide isomerase/thioredoxin
MKSDLGWWRARRIRRAKRADVLVALAIVLLAVATLVFGRRSRAVLRPRPATEYAKVLDELESPRRLPNAMVVDANGKRGQLFDRMTKSRAIVTFYASWCGPCQRELPLLSQRLAKYADILVVVGADDDLEDTRRQLANLGLSDLGFVFDETRELQREGRVTALPTSFVVTRQGAVLERIMGYSAMSLYRIERRLAPRDDAFVMPEGE